MPMYNNLTGEPLPPEARADRASMSVSANSTRNYTELLKTIQELRAQMILLINQMAELQTAVENLTTKKMISDEQMTEYAADLAGRFDGYVARILAQRLPGGGIANTSAADSPAPPQSDPPRRRPRRRGKS